MKALIQSLIFAVFVAFPSLSQTQEEAPLTQEPLQVMVQPHVVQIILNDEHRQGVDWEAIVSDFHTLALKSGDDEASPKQKLSVGVISDEDFAVLLDALDAVGKVTQTKKDMVSLEQDKAQDMDFSVIEPRLRLSMAVKVSRTDKGESQVEVTPKLAHLSKSLEQASSPSYQGTTQLVLPQNATVVVGSIFSEQEVTKLHKFPLLGDLPIVGLVFRNKGRLMQKVETVVFLTTKG